MNIRFSPLKKTDPTQELGVKLNYAPAKRAAYKVRWYLILGLAFSPLILFAAWLYYSWIIVNSPGVISMTSQKLVSPGSGIIEKIFVEVGDNTGILKPLIRIETPVLDAEIKELEREIETLSADSSGKSIQLDPVYSDKVDSAKAHKEDMDKLLGEYRSLHQEKIIDSDLLANMQQLNFQAGLWLQDAEAERLRDHRDQQQAKISGSQVSQVRALKLQLVRLKAERDRYTIRSSDSAVVTDIAASQGDIVVAGQELMFLSARSEVKIFAYLEPKFIDFTELNNEVDIVFPNGFRAKGYISQPVTLIRGLPSRLSTPFENNKAVLKVTLALVEPLPRRLQIEGLPVKVEHGNILMDNPKYGANNLMSKIFDRKKEHKMTSSVQSIKP